MFVFSLYFLRTHPADFLQSFPAAPEVEVKASTSCRPPDAFLIFSVLKHFSYFFCRHPPTLCLSNTNSQIVPRHPCRSACCRVGARLPWWYPTANTCLQCLAAFASPKACQCRRLGAALSLPLTVTAPFLSTLWHPACEPQPKIRWCSRGQQTALLPRYALSVECFCLRCISATDSS